MKSTASRHLAARYVEAVGSDAPVPGGGSVAATVGALAAALAEMVCRLSEGRSDDQTINARLETIRADVETARATLLDLALQDEAAYGSYRAAATLPKSTPEERAIRTGALQAALIGAATVPLRTAEACRVMEDAIAFLLAHGNPHVRSDAEIALILMNAAIQASAINVRVNTAMLKDRTLAADLDRRIDSVLN